MLDRRSGNRHAVHLGIEWRHGMRWLRWHRGRALSQSSNRIVPSCAPLSGTSDCSLGTAPKYAACGSAIT